MQSFSGMPVPLPSVYERPACPTCTTQMYLARIELHDLLPDHDARTFECPVCSRAETMVVKYR